MEESHKIIVVIIAILLLCWCMTSRENYKTTHTKPHKKHDDKELGQALEKLEREYQKLDNMSSEEISSCQFSPRGNCIHRCDNLNKNNPLSVPPGIFNPSDNYISYQVKADELRNKCVKKCDML